MDVTRKGYYTITNPAGELMHRPDGRVLRVTTRDECYEYITSDDTEYESEVGTYIIHCPEREVLRTDLSTHQVLPANDVAPRIISVPQPSFFEGVADDYDMSQHWTDDGRSTVTSEISGTLPSGITYDGNNHLMSYDGSGVAAVSAHALTASDAVGSAISGSFNIEIVEGPYWETIPALPAGSLYNVKQHLINPLNYSVTTRAMKDDQELSVTTDASYSHATGILDYGENEITDVYMEVDYSVGASANVNSVAELTAAISAANSGGETDIILADGTYTLSQGLWVTADNVTIQSASGNRENCIIEGDSMSAGASVTQIITAAGAQNITIKDLTLRTCGTHCIKINGEDNTNGATIRNCILQDSYEQIVKVSMNLSVPSVHGDDGVLEDCLLEFTAGQSPQYYTGGIDAHGAENWVVRRNTFKGIQSPTTQVGEHAIHFWSNATNTIVERNVIINCDRGIGFGLGEDRGHGGGTIKNNFVSRSIAAAGPAADFGITLESAANAKVYNNTVFLEDGEKCIDIRWPDTADAAITNNLCNGVIGARDGGTYTGTTNLQNAQKSWFVDADNGDLRLAATQSTVVDQGTTLAEVTDDIDGNARGTSYDIGGQEFSA